MKISNNTHIRTNTRTHTNREIETILIAEKELEIAGVEISDDTRDAAEQLHDLYGRNLHDESVSGSKVQACVCTCVHIHTCI